MNNKKRWATVTFIILIFLTLGIVLNAVWNQAEPSPVSPDYRELIARYADQYGIPPSVIFAVIQVESNFDAKAESSAGALGLMQMMPTTFSWLTGDAHLREYLPCSALLQPDVSIRYGTYYLHYLYQKFNNNWNTTFAAYNGGEGNVSKWLQDPAYSDENGNLTYIPFEETRKYVEKVTKAEQAYQHENNAQ